MVYEKLSKLPKNYKLGITQCVETILAKDIMDLKAIILFGGCARMDLHVGSDIDFLIVTGDEIQDRKITGSLRSDVELIALKLDVDLVFSTAKKLKESKEQLFLHIREEGVTLWEGGSYTDEYKQLLSNCQ